MADSASDWKRGVVEEWRQRWRKEVVAKAEGGAGGGTWRRGQRYRARRQISVGGHGGTQGQVRVGAVMGIHCQ
jgi:hypothetical protein